MELTETQKLLRRRILEISHKHHLSHLGSCLTAVDIIEEIYQQKSPDERFVLSCGHAGLALYVVLEKHYLTNALALFDACGVHPDRRAGNAYMRRIWTECRFQGEPPQLIDCSTGSLGQGLPIAVGMALSDRSKNVYCLISDGELAEGSIREAMAVWDRERLNNLRIYVNYNGWAAYRDTSEDIANLATYGFHVHRTSPGLPFLQGLDAHYHVMTDAEYEQAMEVLQ